MWISVLCSGLAPTVAPMHREARCSRVGAARISSTYYGAGITPDAHRSLGSRKRHGLLRDAAATPLSRAKATCFTAQERHSLALQAHILLTGMRQPRDITQLLYGMSRSVCRFAPQQLSSKDHSRPTQGR